MLPNTLFIGPGRTATTSMFAALSKHTDVCTASRKEVDRYRVLLFAGELGPLGEYAKQFSHYRGERIVLDATPGYMFGGEAIANAAVSELGNVKVVSVLRDPVDRLFSLYRHVRTKLDSSTRDTFTAYVDECSQYDRKSSFDEVSIQYSGLIEGEYVEYLKEWECVVGSGNLLLLCYDELQNEPSSSLARIGAFLDIDVTGVAVPHDNRSIATRSRVLQDCAQFFSIRFESFFRRHYRLKHWLRSAYHSVNAVDGPRMSADDQLRLLSYYTESVNALAQFMRERGLDRPRWMSRYEVSFK